MILVVKTRSQNPRLVLQQKKEPWKTKTMDDWEKEQLQKTFELLIQQMQTLESIMEAVLKSQLSMQEPFGLLKTWTSFGDDGTIIEKQDLLQEIGQQLLCSKHTLTLVNLCIWPLI